MWPFKKKLLKEDLDISDDFSTMYLAIQVYLKELVELVIVKANNSAGHRKFDTIEIDESIVSDKVQKMFPSIIDDAYSSQIFNYLVVAGYLKSDSNEPKNIQYVFVTEKGWAAAMIGEFKMKHEERQVQLWTLKELKKSTESHNRQKKINVHLIIIAIITAIVPAIIFSIDRIWPIDKKQSLPQPIEVRLDPSFLNNLYKQVETEKARLLEQSGIQKEPVSVKTNHSTATVPKKDSTD